MKRLSGSAGTGEIILNNWNLFNYDLTDEKKWNENEFLFTFKFSLNLQDNITEGTFVILLKRNSNGYYVDRSSTLNSNNFQRPLGIYNDTAVSGEGLYEVAKRMIEDNIKSDKITYLDKNISFINLKIKKIKIFEENILKNDNIIGKISIIIGGLGRGNPKEFMDKVVLDYVGYRSYNEFIENTLDNPWVRIIIEGINEFDYIKNEKYEIFEYTFQKKGKISVLRGGFKEGSPNEFMDKIVSDYIGYKAYNEYIESTFDNPWVRVIIEDINELNYENKEI